MDLLFGLPAHPLLIHLTLVLVPLCLVVAIASAVRPAWRARLLPILLGLAVVTAVMAVVTASAGEKLALRVPESPLIAVHAELGEQLRLLTLVFAGVVTLAVLLERLGRRAVSTAMAVIVVAVGSVATVWDVRAGHAGAKAVWQGTAEAQPRTEDD